MFGSLRPWGSLLHSVDGAKLPGGRALSAVTASTSLPHFKEAVTSVTADPGRRPHPGTAHARDTHDCHTDLASPCLVKSGVFCSLPCHDDSTRETAATAVCTASLSRRPRARPPTASRSNRAIAHLLVLFAPKHRVSPAPVWLLQFLPNATFALFASGDAEKLERRRAPL